MQDLLQIKKTTIEVGLEREYRFFQISDIHMSCVDEESSDTDIRENKRFHGQWDSLKRVFAKDANELCDERYDIEPYVLFEMLTDYAIKGNCDGIIFSGDIFDRINETNIRYMKSFLDKCPIPVIYCPGNHCWMDENGNKATSQYHRLKGIINNPECDSFDFGEFQIVSIDNGIKKITDKQLKFLSDKIKEGKKILLVVHAPLNIGKFGEVLAKKVSPYFLLGVNGDCENAFLFNQMIESNENSFVAVLAGHIHFFFEEKITDNLTQYTTSSGLIGAGREIIIR